MKAQPLAAILKQFGKAQTAKAMRKRRKAKATKRGLPRGKNRQRNKT